MVGVWLWSGVVPWLVAWSRFTLRPFRRLSPPRITLIVLLSTTAADRADLNISVSVVLEKGSQ